MSDEKNTDYFHGNIEQVDLDEQMREYYLDYSMSVIVGRALPDVRDGLKPVHRRILYTMSGLGLTPDKPYHKSASVVGTCMAWYHPHGDSSIYDAMVKLAQEFYMRAPLVDGRGNFGTIDGDPPAAYRYTEARMSKLALEMLRDIEKDTVDFMPNFDEKKDEPVVLPSRFPNLLVNGSSGIAVGMATSIPPHNLREVVNGVIELIDNKDATDEDVLKHIKGPDFPTGATVLGLDAIKNAYLTGRGKVTVRAKATIEEIKNGKSEIIFTEIPYQVNKARLVEKIAQLVRDKIIDGITDLRDESSKKVGIKIVVETRRDVNPNIILNQLYKHSQLQTVFSIILLSIVDGKPMILPVKEMLSYYLNFQKEVVTRRTKFDLEKAMDRLHIVEGYLIAIDNIDEVIKVIRSAYDDAKEKLMDKFDLSEKQAEAILEMRLRRLQGLEKEKLLEEEQSLKEKIDYYNSILADEEKLLCVIKEEITEIKDKFGSDRKTDIVPQEDEIDIKDMIPNEEVTITFTHQGYIKRLPADTYKAQKRGGKGISSMTTKEEDFVQELILTTNHEKMIYLTNKGRIYTTNIYEIPQSSRTAKGTNIVNIIPIEKGEKVTSMITTNAKYDDKYLIMCTKYGTIKKTKVSEFTKSTRQGIIAINLKEGDELINCLISEGNTQLILSTRLGKSIRFEEKDVRAMGRTAAGVRAVRLDKDDEVLSMEICQENKQLLVISENGYGKRTSLSEYNTQARGGKGVITYRITPKTGSVAGAVIVDENDQVMIITTEGQMIRISADEISLSSRATMGVRLMKIDENSKISAIAVINPEDEEKEEISK